MTFLHPTSSYTFYRQQHTTNGATHLPQSTHTYLQVLLDSALQVKIADFGMSHIVPVREVSSDDDWSEYASNYVTMKGEALPVRWAAIEVCWLHIALLLFAWRCAF